MEQNKRIQEIRLLENSLQNLLMQRQVFQIEFAETDSALNQLESSGDEVFKIVGQLMIKTGREKAKELPFPSLESSSHKSPPIFLTNSREI